VNISNERGSMFGIFLTCFIFILAIPGLAFAARVAISKPSFIVLTWALLLGSAAIAPLFLGVHWYSIGRDIEKPEFELSLLVDFGWAEIGMSTLTAVGIALDVGKCRTNYRDLAVLAFMSYWILGGMSLVGHYLLLAIIVAAA
jgi:hypothetical protein